MTERILTRVCSGVEPAVENKAPVAVTVGFTGSRNS